MAISLFRGELLISHAIRSERIGLGRPIVTAKLHFKMALRNYGPGSFRLPMKIGRASNDDLENVTKIFRESTAWPLLDLFRGGDLQEAFGHYDLSDYVKCVPEKKLRFCPDCATFQYNERSISWWMRDHNLPLVAVCPIHKVPLHCVDREHILADAGRLPHETKNFSKPIAEQIDDESVRIANLIISLCNQYAVLDIIEIKKWLKTNLVEVSTKCKREQISTIASRAFRRLSASDPSTNDDGLIDVSYIEEYLSVVAFACEDIQIFSYKDELLPQGPIMSESRKHEIVYQLLSTNRLLFMKTDRMDRFIAVLKSNCKNFKLKEPAKWGSIDLLLINFLDRKWVVDHLNPPMKLTNRQIDIGLYVLGRALSCHPLQELNVMHCRRVKYLIKSDPVFPGWSISFADACALQVKTFVNAIEYGRFPYSFDR